MTTKRSDIAAAVLIIAGLMLVFLLTTAQLAGASVLGAVVSGAGDWFLSHALESLITLVLMIVSAFFGGTVWGRIILKAKVPLQEAADVLLAVRKARASDSPGGAGMTDEERAEVWQQVEELIASIAALGGNNS